MPSMENPVEITSVNTSANMLRGKRVATFSYEILNLFLENPTFTRMLHIYLYRRE